MVPESKRIPDGEITGIGRRKISETSNKSKLFFRMREVAVKANSKSEDIYAKKMLKDLNAIRPIL